MINRKIDKKLDEFFELNRREAILIDGARQVGKTWSVRAFGHRHFKHVVEINFIKTPGAKELFAGVLNESDLFAKISTLTDEEMIPGETLIFFDEVPRTRPITCAHLFFLKIPWSFTISE